MLPLTLFGVLMPAIRYLHFETCLTTIVDENFKGKTAATIDFSRGNLAGKYLKLNRCPKIEFDSSHVDTVTSDHKAINDYIINYLDYEQLNETLTKLRNGKFWWNSRGKYLIVTNDAVRSTDEIRDVLRLLWNYSIYNSAVFAVTENHGTALFSYDFVRSKCGADIQPEKVAACENGSLVKSHKLYGKKMSNDLCNGTFKVLWCSARPFAIDYKLQRNPGILISLMKLIGERNNLNMVFTDDPWKYMSELEYLEIGNAAYEDFNNGNGDILITIGGYDSQKCLYFYDCTVPAHYEYVYWILPKPHKNALWKGIFVAYSLQTWLLVSFVLIASAIVFWRASDPRPSLARSAVTAFRMMLSASDNFTEPRTWSFRVFFVAFSFSCILLGNCYQGRLYSFLSEPGYERGIATLDDILGSGLPLQFRAGFGLLFLFAGEKNLRVFERFIESNLSHDYTLQFAVTHNNLITIANLGQMIVNPHLVGSFNTLEIYSFHISLSFKRDHVLFERFDSFMQTATESGFYVKWVSDIQIEYFKRPPTEEKGAFQLTIDHVQGALILLGIGYSLSLTVFISELLVVHQCYLFDMWGGVFMRVSPP